MKAMILAAGLGTRLLPLTKRKPKPLVPLADRPLIDILIRRLQDSGCEAVMINTHHLGQMIKAFLEAQSYDIPVLTTYEPTLLDTGGAIKNVENFWDAMPFMVINGDVFSDIDLKSVYAYHLGHDYPVTMVLQDYEVFNNVWVDPSHCIRGFGISRPCPPGRSVSGSLTNSGNATDDEYKDLRRLAFTGIQVVDARILDSIPKGIPCSIIDIYCDLLRRGTVLKGFVPQGHYWYDIGSMEGYHEAAKEALARKALSKTCSGLGEGPLVWSRLKGDGSDRSWQRAVAGQSSVILVDHGPPPDHGTCEADSFAAIGAHLYGHGIPVPKIFGYDRFQGILALEDLGDLHLQKAVRQATTPDLILNHYRKVVDVLVSMGVDGAIGFEPNFTYQTPSYDRDLILEKEALYFCDAFLGGLLGVDVAFQDLKNEFELLAENALSSEYFGFLHRDFQSRNILVSKDGFHVIDFQGARLGPLQYDLASLLIDPYVALPRSLQEDLLAYYLEKLSQRMAVDASSFVNAYRYCAINRNLQILGAFAFLGKGKGKKDFLDYIPVAVASLKDNLTWIDVNGCTEIKKIVEKL